MSMRIKTRWLLLVSILAVVVAGLAWQLWPEPAIGPASFQRIQIGMTQAEVVAIMGILPSDYIEATNLWINSGARFFPFRNELASIPVGEFYSTFSTKGKMYGVWYGNAYNIKVVFDESNRTVGAILEEVPQYNVLDRTKEWLGISGDL
jgi:hypothetical protein